MKKHLNKIIAPVIVSFCLICAFLAYGLLLINLDIPNIFIIIIVIAAIILTIVVVMVLLERIKEIKKGEEDDLGKY